MPFDLVPDLIPVAGALDAILVAVVLVYVARTAGPRLIEELGRARREGSGRWWRCSSAMRRRSRRGREDAVACGSAVPATLGSLLP
jgi:uncharacterized membrane protein YkvA (DUF1232 family)